MDTLKNTIYQYTNDFRIVRQDNANGVKKFFAEHKFDDKWKKGQPPGHDLLPLYNLDGVESADEVFVVEGEKCANALNELGFCATTSAFGSNSAQKSDWSPLTGKTVYLCPDNDEAGSKYIEQVARQLMACDASLTIKLITLPNLGEGEDIVDFIARRRNQGKSDSLTKCSLKKLRVRSPIYRSSASIETYPSLTKKTQLGDRNNELTRLAGQLCASGHSKQNVFSCLQKFNQLRMDPPLDDIEVERIARSISQYLPRDESPKPHALAYQQFPVDALPKHVSNYVTAAAAAIGCDPAYIATPLLAVLGAAIGTTYRIQLKSTWSEFPVIWAVIVGKSGTHKSPALRTAVKFVQDAQNEAKRIYAESMEEYETQWEQYELDLEEWHASGEDDNKPEEPVEPRLNRYICSDVTIEAVAGLLEHNPRGLLLQRDELSGWLGSYGRYTHGSSSGDVAMWLEAFGANPLIVDRKTGDRPEIYVPQAFIGITGSIQPSVLKDSMGQQHLENGLFARFLMCYPPELTRTWTEDVVDQKVDDSMRKIVRRLLSARLRTDENGIAEPIDIKLSPKAKAVWTAFYNEHAMQMQSLPDVERATWSKLEGYAARIALIIYKVKRLDGEMSILHQDMIDPESMVNAIRIVQWFGREARRVITMFSERKDQQTNRELKELIHKHGGIITADSLRRVTRRYPTNEKADEALDQLALGGHGIWRKRSSRSSGGRPTFEFMLAKTDAVTETQESVKAPIAKNNRRIKIKKSPATTQRRTTDSSTPKKKKIRRKRPSRLLWGN